MEARHYKNLLNKSNVFNSGCCSVLFLFFFSFLGSGPKLARKLWEIRRNLAGIYIWGDINLSVMKSRYKRN